ncbi:MAG: hypothetical protein IPQ06_12925 [Chitinophagaceae bacterium]|nr:hypothetical protein [Chitinophagaceae bacterium]
MPGKANLNDSIIKILGVTEDEIRKQKINDYVTKVTVADLTNLALGKVDKRAGYMAKLTIDDLSYFTNLFSFKITGGKATTKPHYKAPKNPPLKQEDYGTIAWACTCSTLCAT